VFACLASEQISGQRGTIRSFRSNPPREQTNGDGLRRELGGSGERDRAPFALSNAKTKNLRSTQESTHEFSDHGSENAKQSRQGHRGDVGALRIYLRGRLTHGLRRWFISACRNASARTEVVELVTHNAKGEVIAAYTSWEWSTLCDEITKLDVDLEPTELVVLPLAKRETPEIARGSDQAFASDFVTRDQSEMIPSAYQWRRWESNPTVTDTLTLRGHSVFPRIAIIGVQPDLLLPYPEVPWNAPACPALWSLCGH
jgi:hypothetical protein